MRIGRTILYQTSFAALGAVLVCLLAGCGRHVEPAQLHVADPVVQVRDAHTVGQTFVAQHDGLDGIDLWLIPAEERQGTLRLHLRAEPGAAQELATATFPLAQVTAPGFYRFSFPPIPDSRGRYFYFFLEAEGGGTVSLGAMTGDAYLDGALYDDHQPQDAQMAFRLAYAQRYVLFGALRTALEGLGLFLVAGLLYVVPGWALLILVRKGEGGLVGHWAEGLGVAAGLGLALYPVLMLWTDVVGIHLGPGYVGLVVGGGLAVLLWHYRPWRLRRARPLAALRRWRRGEHFWPDVALIGVVTLAGMGRLFSVQGLDMPLWDDSVQHTIMTQRILESGGLFSSWQPYAPYHTVTTHFGFPVDVAAWAWLTGSDAPQAVITAGQIINLLAVVTLFPLVYRIKGVWAGVVALLVVGMVDKFPAYYSNWGRYPQVASQAILPVAAWWVWMIFYQRRARAGRYAVVGGVLVAGLVLAYYRMAFHFVAFVVAALLVLLARPRRLWSWRNWLVLVGIVVIALASLFPVIQNIAERYITDAPADTTAVSGEQPGFWEAVQQVNVRWSAPQVAVVLVGILAGVWVGSKAALPVVWLLALLLLPVLQLTPLPGVSVIQAYTIQTSLYMPRAWIWGVLGGYVVGELLRRARWLRVALALAVLAVAVGQMPALLSIIDRGFDLSARPDIRAARWIEETLPDDAFFLINGIVYDAGQTALAGDAGSWLPILTRRGVVIPSQYALLMEKPDQLGYSQAVNDLVRRLFETSPVTSEGHQAICAFPEPITHLYLGQRRGLAVKALPRPPAQPMLPADQLLQDPALRLVYHQDRVMILEFNRDVCP